MSGADSGQLALDAAQIDQRGQSISARYVQLVKPARGLVQVVADTGQLTQQRWVNFWGRHTGTLGRSTQTILTHPLSEARFLAALKELGVLCLGQPDLDLFGAFFCQFLASIGSGF